MTLNTHLPTVYSERTTLGTVNDFLVDTYHTIEHGDQTNTSRASAPAGRMNRIAIFTDNDFDTTNGITTMLRAVLRHAPSDLQPRIYTMSAIGSDEPEYLALASTGVGMWSSAALRMYVPQLAAFRRHLTVDDVRLVHITTPGPAGLAARYLAASSGLPTVGSVHTLSPGRMLNLGGSPLLSRLPERYLRWLYGRSTQLLVASEAMEVRLRQLGWNGNRLSMWRRGVDPEAFSPARRSSKLREQWRVCDRRPAIMYAGRLARDKGLALLPPLDSLLHRHHVPCRLIIVGDGPMMGELRAACPDAVFLGSLPHHEVGTAMASADVFVFPSDTMTAGTVVLEAQACGLPVLVSQRGGAHEQVEHGRTGFVCDASDSFNFGRRAMELLTSREGRAAVGAAARAHARSRSWQSALEPLFTAYRVALAARAQHHGPPVARQAGIATG